MENDPYIHFPTVAEGIGAPKSVTDSSFVHPVLNNTKENRTNSKVFIEFERLCMLFYN